MKRIMSSSTNYVLAAPIESLHSESVVWINELRFWEDEIKFFHKLLQGISAKGFPDVMSAEIDRDLIKWKTEKLNKVQTGVASHERLLSLSIRTESWADQKVYRETHKKLSKDIQALAEDIQQLKRRVFALVP